MFLFGIAKNDRRNLDDDELEAWRRVGRGYLALTDSGLQTAMAEDELIEVEYADDD